jgi:aminopeptidase
MATAVDTRLERYAELAVRVGANVAEGQALFITSQPAHAPLARALTRAAYAAGAAYVDVVYADQHLRRAMIELGPDEALTYTPSWMRERAQAIGGNANIGTTGDPEPALLADLDPDRVGKAYMRELREIVLRQFRERSVNWTAVAYPSEAWAEQIFGEPDVERLWEAVAFTTRLDDEDPVEAWREHVARLSHRAAQLNELKLDALHYRGPGTDLTVGLLEQSRWISGETETAAGIRYVANMPTEEVFTTPDRRRADGVVASTKPLALLGDVVEGLTLRLEHGRIVDVTADHGAELVKAQIATDDGAAHLGEVALVDGTSRVAKTGLIFRNTLFDENATSHIAWGFAIPEAVRGDGGDAVNVSAVHTDFMVGGDDVEIDGITRDGRSVPLLRDSMWQLPE